MCSKHQTTHNYLQNGSTFFVTWKQWLQESICNVSTKTVNPQSPHVSTTNTGHIPSLPSGVKSRHIMTLRDWDHAYPVQGRNPWNTITLHPHSSNPQCSVVFHCGFLNNILSRHLAHSSRVPQQSGLSNRNVFGIRNPSRECSKPWKKKCQGMWIALKLASGLPFVPTYFQISGS